ncbi:hypothetical protein B9Z55_017805 [Caenorhabditis nigoni]|uniref:Uncharacterized protein n=1 Tax=Caenorhabditis nigoni TaxID=1611254 RepID=A0A2G5TBN4_9PELO|nr:hypothetical protein B9Z55_017805 [Caenorhabditis nigoni]
MFFLQSDAIASGKHIISEEGEDFVDAFLVKMEKDKKDGVKDSTFTLETLAIDLYDLWLAGSGDDINNLDMGVCVSSEPS